MPNSTTLLRLILLALSTGFAVWPFFLLNAVATRTGYRIYETWMFLLCARVALHLIPGGNRPLVVFIAEPWNTWFFLGMGILLLCLAAAIPRGPRLYLVRERSA